MDVTGKTILITGSSEGIGAECARLFSKSGANLVLVARTKSKLEEIAEEIRNDCKVLLVPMDISDTRSCKKLISKTVSEFGSLDILINNAGMHERGDFYNLSVDDIGKMVDVNLRAPMILSSMALPHMRSAGSGSIVMITSLAGMSPLQGAAIYSSTKAGLRAFGFALYDELKDANIHIGMVSPGPVSTGFILRSIDDVEDIVFSQPMSTPEEVAIAVSTVIKERNIEIAMPKISGILATLAYLFPRLRRAMRPSLYANGKKNKEKYRHG